MSPQVYLLLAADGRRTYVGCTTRGVAHRLREHNGDLSGGAQQTRRGRPWSVHCVVEGFRTHQEALQFEYAWRRVHRRGRFAYTPEGRAASRDALMALPRWSSRAPLASEVPLVVVVTTRRDSPATPPER